MPDAPAYPQAQQGMRVMKDTINEDEEYEGEEDRPGQPSPAPSPLSAVPEAMPAPKHQPAALGADVFRLPRPRKVREDMLKRCLCLRLRQLLGNAVRLSEVII